MQNQYTTIVFILEIIGTIAFASSGAMVGIRKKMDVFGVLVLGVTTAVGGGCIRDLILGIHPPKMFHNFVYVGTAITTSLIIFLVLYKKRKLLEGNLIKSYEQIMNAFDAIGLGVFTVVGIQTTLTVSGDVLTGSMPFIFVKHIYASASLIGAILYVILHNRINHIVAMVISMGIVILIRFLATKYRWNLPRIQE